MGDIEKSSDNLWSFLAFTGYLKVKEAYRKEEDVFYNLSIPNREVRSVYKNIIENWFKDTITKENYSLMVIPRDVSKLGIVIEFKKLDPDDEETLEETAEVALKQIKDKKYSTTLEDRGIKNIKEIGIVFKGKEIYIKEGI